ncbi:MAG: STAS domain-containing protein [Planctomycetota bacterium]|jgi:anti-anti-sigma factor
MKFEKKNVNGATVLSFNEECYLDNATEETFKDNMRLYLEESKKIALDCANLHYINSMGLGAIIAIHNFARQTGAKLVFFNLPERIQNFFKTTRMDLLLTLAEDEMEGLKKLEK